MTAYFITFFITFLHPKYRINYVMTNGISVSSVSDVRKTPVKCAIAKEIRPSEEGRIFLLVEVSGFEPEVSWTRTKRDTKLRHTSIA